MGHLASSWMWPLRGTDRIGEGGKKRVCPPLGCRIRRLFYSRHSSLEQPSLTASVLAEFRTSGLGVVTAPNCAWPQALVHRLFSLNPAHHTWSAVPPSDFWARHPFSEKALTDTLGTIAVPASQHGCEE